MKKAAMSVLVTAITVMGSTLAHAALPGDQPLSRQVNYSDLNLDQPAGAAVLYNRLSSAAHVVCKPFEGKALVNFKRHRTCVAKAISTAVRDVNAPTLTNLYRAKTGEQGIELAKR
jgi:UrcA family protein